MADPPAKPRSLLKGSCEKRVNTAASDVGDVLRNLAGHRNAAVEMVVGIEHWRDGEISLLVGGDGAARVCQRRAGEVRSYERQLDGNRVAEFGRTLEDQGLTTLVPSRGDRLPDDVRVTVRVMRAGDILHEAVLWHGDRYRDAGFDAVLREYEALVADVSNGALLGRELA